MREVRAGTDADSMEVHCLLACSPRFVQLAFLFNPRPPAQGDDAEVDWVLPLKSSQERVQQTPAGRPDGSRLPR